MRSISVGQAALLAAIALVALALFDLAANAVVLGDSPLLVVLGSSVPSLVWAGFFFSLHRSISSARIAAWITLVFAVMLESVVTYIRFQQAVSYWTPFGSALSINGWILRLGWAFFLVAFAAGASRSLTGIVALALVIFSAPLALSAAYNAWNGGIEVLVSGDPPQNLWRVLITPGVRAFYWASQVLFLWIFWRDRA